jgi:peptidoglycan/xylan/chitin deacetylase (PgdA/CDA1 family)
MRGAATIRSIAGLPVVDRVARTLSAVVPRRRDVLAVLTFHRVAAREGAVPGLLSATPDGFGRLLDLVAARFRVVSIEEVLERAGGGPALPARSLLLTFDDGYTDVADAVWPALARRSLPAIAFVPTAFPGDPSRSFWWERVWAAIRATRRAAVTIEGRSLPLRSPDERALAYRAVRSVLKASAHAALEAAVDELERQLIGPDDARPAPSGRSLDWASLVSLRASGLALASHTRTHPLLTHVEGAALRDEIDGGVEDLRRATGSDLPAFAYPSGAYDERAVRAVGAAGIRAAFTTERGVNDLRDADWLRLRRINVAVGTSPSLILAQAVR